MNIIWNPDKMNKDNNLFLRSCSWPYTFIGLKQCPNPDWLCSQGHGDMVNEMEIDKIMRLDDSQVSAIRSLWSDAGIQECYDRRREYQLTDSAK